MTLNLDRDQEVILREILESQLKQLRFESARADLRDFREQLHGRERVVESLLTQLPEPA